MKEFFFQKKIVLLCFFVLLFSFSSSFAQQKFTISGTVRDSSSGEAMIGASVLIKDLSIGTVSNAYGFFSLTAPAGTYTVTAGFFSYKTQHIPVILDKNLQINIELPSQILTLTTVEITSEKRDQNITSSQMSANRLDVQQIKTLPVLFGEIDILKTITLLPGIQSAGEGNAGLYVRGGAADQNLILLDEANVYNASHLLGFFSVFNADAINDITVIKGGIPAEYGGRLSSVMDIHMNEGNNKKFSVKGGIGLISSRLTIESPIRKEMGSFIISVRRTYADLFIRKFGPSNVQNTSLYFYDLNVKANYRITDKDRLFLSGYYGRDVFTTPQSGINWGNYTGTLRWNHIFNEKLFLNSSLITSNYNYRINVNSGSNDFGITSSIRDYTLKNGFEYYTNPKNKLKFGTSSIYHIFSPGNVSTNGKSILPDLSIQKKYAMENALYISNEQIITKKLTVIYGLRYSFFDMMGPGKVFNFDSAGGIVDSSIVTNHKIIKQYAGLEPRLSIRYQIDSVSSIKTSYTRTSQYVQLLSNTTASTPIDLWIPCSNIITPQLGDQYALGYFRNLKNNMFEASVEAYYKTMINQVDYKPGADLVLNPLVESQLLFGKARAYGAEFFVKKNTGKFTGWISYTLSRTERQFTQINNGEWYAAKQDRTHDVSVVLSYQPVHKWIFAATWVYATGNAVTFPVGKYEYEGQIVSYYTGRNGYRMPAYHRMDISATYRIPKKRKIESEWNFSVYNVYDRHNAYSINFQQDPNDPTKTQAVKTWLFGIIPAITYNFKF